MSRRDRMKVARQFIAWNATAVIPPRRVRCGRRLKLNAAIRKDVLSEAENEPARLTEALRAVTHHTAPYGADLLGELSRQ